MERVKEGCDEETLRQWLKLSLGGDAGSPVEDSDLSTRTSRTMFPCEFCTRKFYSVHALGGHQNAHRTERSEARRKRMTKLMDIAVRRSLGVQAHAFVQKPSREGILASARITVSSQDCDMKVPYTLAEWPGGFHMDRKPLEELSDAEKLDLNLKL
ncbi:zinc finger protein 1-like [Apium graveolens]|uniref:zinc finger protein 1-like n=1 Tax=Apium graveolens TaxID=4045 RepID=UPI003D7B8165